MNGLVHAILTNRDYYAAASLLLALLANWALGSLDALARGEFSFQAWPRIIRSQLASKELLVIYATYGGSLASAVVAYFLTHSGIIDRSLLTFIVGRLVDVAAAASAIYSVALWRECATQLADLGAALLALGSPTKPAKLNQPRAAAA